MNQKLLDEDLRELEAHFAERVQAYFELGETPEQAVISAREKFGETERALGELQRQRLRHSPILWGLISAGGYLLLVSVVKAPWTSWMFFGYYLLFAWQTTTKKPQVSR